MYHGDILDDQTQEALIFGNFPWTKLPGAQGQHGHLHHHLPHLRIVRAPQEASDACRWKSEVWSVFLFQGGFLGTGFWWHTVSFNSWNSLIDLISTALTGWSGFVVMSHNLTHNWVDLIRYCGDFTQLGHNKSDSTSLHPSYWNLVMRFRNEGWGIFPSKDDHWEHNWEENPPKSIGSIVLILNLKKIGAGNPPKKFFLLTLGFLESVMFFIFQPSIFKGRKC